MPAKTVTVVSKSRDGLKKLVSKKIKEFADRGMVYVTSSYDPRRVKKN